MTIHSRPADSRPPAELLKVLDAQGAELATLKQLAYIWSEPTLSQLVFALDVACDTARNPRHPGQLAARQLLEAFVKGVRKAETTVAGISVISAPLPGHNGEGS